MNIAVSPLLSSMIRILFGALLVVFSCSTIGSAQSIKLSDWNTLSSLRAVRSVDIDNSGTFWVATSGGIYSYTGDSAQTKEYRNINALQSLDIRAIICVHDAADPSSDLVIAGGADGTLDILDADNSWDNISDIKRASQYSRRGITAFRQVGNTLFITTEFGLVTFDLRKRLFIETIDRIGTLQEKTPVNGLTIRNDSVWLATDSGLAVAPLEAPSLRLPEVWTVIRSGGQLPKTPITDIAGTATTMYCASDTVVYKVEDGVVTPVYTAKFPILDLSTSNNRLYWSDLSGIGTLTGRYDISWNANLEGHSSIVRNDSVYLLGFLSGIGLGIWDFASVQHVNLNSPVSNKFARMAIDSKGGLWIATDIEPPRAGEGVNYFDGTRWTAINQRNSTLASNACYRVTSLPDGSVLVGTWGRGAVIMSMDNGTPQIVSLLPGTNSIKGISADSTFGLVADAAIDASGTIWMINEQAANQLFVSYAEAGNTKSYANCVDSRSNQFRSIAVDLANNKWAGSTIGSGLVVWNDRNTDDRSDDLCNVVRSSNSQLPDNVINALAIDLSGALWIGTPKGLAVMSYPSGASNSGIPYVRRILQLTTPVVNDIFVDALNYKWIATSTGVFVLNEDGTEVLAEITRTTAPLLDDNIRCVVVNAKTGVAYFGTSTGCTTAQTSSIQPSPDYTLSVYPQPFKPSEDGQVVIDGLAADSDVRILTVNGALVLAMQVRGRQTTWDGNDYQGRPVPPGVYLVQVSSASSKQSSVSKIAVQR